MEKFILTIEADAVVIPGPETQLKWAEQHLAEKYGPLAGKAEENTE